MKIFYIDPQSYNNLSTYDSSLLNNVTEHDVSYYYSDLYQYDTLPGNVNKCYFHYNKKRTSLAKVASYVLSIARISKDALVLRPDVIHIQWIKFWYVDYFFAWLMIRLGIRVIFTAHNILPHTVRSSDKSQYKKYYQLVDDIIVHSNRTRKELVDLMGVSPAKVHVILHGILASGIEKRTVEERTRKLKEELSIKSGDIVLSCLGVQKKYKGTELVVKVWTETPELRNSPKLHLLMVGRNYGIDYSSLVGCDNVYVLDDMISDLDFEAYLELSSVVLLPYVAISQSGILFSALNRNVPVLVSDVGGLAEPLEYGNIGWNIGEPTYDNLKNSIMHIVSNPQEIAETRNALSEFENVRRKYSWENIGMQTSELYSIHKGMS